MVATMSDQSAEYIINTPKVSETEVCKHICTLDRESAEIFKRNNYLNSFQQTIQIWRDNPNAKYFYHSYAYVDEERKILRESKYGYLILHPFSFFRYVWESIQLVILILGFTIHPVNLIYGPLIQYNMVCIGFGDIAEFIDIFCDIMYVVEIFMLFTTGYIAYSKRKVYVTHESIRWKYLTSLQFYIDLLSSLSLTLTVKLYMIYGEPEENLSWIFYVKLFSLLKLLRVVRFTIYFNRATSFFRSYYFTLASIKYGIYSLLFLHVVTCFYVMMHQYIIFYSNAKVDLKVSNLLHRPMMVLPYADMYASGYFTILSFLLHIHRQNVPGYSEKLDELRFLDVSTFVILATLGFIFSCIITILLIQMLVALHWPALKYYSVINEVSKYMLSNNMPHEMQIRIYTYYKYCFKSNYFSDTVISKQLSESLIYDINLYSCRSLIEIVPIFKDLSIDSLSEIVRYLTYHVFLHNDTIIHAGDTESTCMYFIYRGSVVVTTPTGREICHLQDGAYFGEISLILPKQKRVANVIAIEICEVYKLERHDFLKCFEDSTQFYKKIEQTARERREKTVLLEELHKKYLIDRTTKRRFK